MITSRYSTRETAAATSSSADFIPKLKFSEWDTSDTSPISSCSSMKRTGFAHPFFSPSQKHIATDKTQIEKRGGRVLSYHHHWGPLLAPGNTQSNRRIPISSLQGSTTAYVSRDLLSHLPISKKNILQWMKVKNILFRSKMQCKQAADNPGNE